MIKSKLYLYDSEAEGYKGTDYTRYILLGETETNDLTEELDTKEITLSGLEFKEAFEPTTKFIEEIYEDGELVETQNWVVQQDLVEKPILANSTYYKHNISLIEPSAIAQQRTCDNFSVSYKLQDISLEQTADVDPNLESYKKVDNLSKDIPTYMTFGEHTGEVYVNKKVYDLQWQGALRYVWEFKNEDERIKWETFKQYNTIGTQIDLTLPLLKITETGNRGWQNRRVLGYASVDFKITKKLGGKEYYLNNSNQWVETETVRRIDPATSTEGEWQQHSLLPQAQGDRFSVFGKSNGWILNRVSTDLVDEKYSSNPELYYKHTCFVYHLKQVAHYISIPQYRNVLFTIEDGAFYQIEGYIHNFEKAEDNINIYDYNNLGVRELVSWRGGYRLINLKYIDTIGVAEHTGNIYAQYDSGVLPMTTLQFNGKSTTYFKGGVIAYHTFNAETIDATMVQTTNAIPNLQISTYAYSNETKSYFVTSAPPVSAYDLFLKAIITSQTLYKTQDTWQEFLDTLTFYTSESDIALLKSTQIVEADYNEKNLWEMFIEIGKYIHAIPRIVFGENDRFLVEWQKLGVAGADYLLQDTATPISIYNSKKLEEYVSACDSYITNMVQLGGQIDEWVAPKSSSEDYLVYNDVAEIKVSKPIMEIVNMEIIGTNPSIRTYNIIRNLTGKGTSNEEKIGYVFESSIYQLLSVRSDMNINKGLAIYYELGDNVIKGLSYQLPTVSGGDVDSDYAMKRIIANVYGFASSEDIKINDYLFHIVYRTKDSLREVQTRPDLRKYLLNSKFDKAPIHKQFNNQTDIMADSVKFGNSIYGKLIKTGNLGYTVSEWCSSYANIKKVGYLYNINGNLYYLSKITKTYLGTQVNCQLEFSKDYNQLSALIGIPSEPRFYEISERNIVPREIAWNDYLVLGTTNSAKSNVVSKKVDYLKNIILGNETTYPSYMSIAIKNIADKPIDTEKLVGAENFKKVFMLPCSVYSCKNTLSFECDTIDNFSAGDQVGAEKEPTDKTKYNGVAYRELLPYQYCDPMGRGDMFEFAVINPTFSGYDKIRKLPECVIDSRNEWYFGNSELLNYVRERGTTISNKTGIVVMKDSREQLSFNYNLQMLTDSDRFVLSGYLWQLQKGNIGLVLLNKEINKISNDTIPIENIVNYSFGGFSQYTAPIQTEYLGGSNFEIKIKAMLESKFTAEEIENAKAIAIISNKVPYNSNQEQYFIMGRNVSDLSIDEKKASWFISEYDVSQARTNTNIEQ